MHDHTDHHHDHHDQPARPAHSVLRQWIRLNRHWILIALMAAYLASGLYYVPADQQAVRIRLGRLRAERIQPGLHYSLPYPFERVVRLKFNEAQRLSIGGTDLTRALGVNSAAAGDYLLSGDQNLVRVEASIQYYIQDPTGYLFRADNLATALENLFFRCLSGAIASGQVDDILTTGRIALQNDVQKALQQEAERLELGVAVTMVSLERVGAPEEVRDAFLEVANSREDRNRIVQEASGYAGELLPVARGRAQEMLQQAAIYRTELVNRARGESERFTNLWWQYRDHRQVTTARLILETMEQILPRVRKVILDAAGSKQGVDLDIFEVQKKD